MSNADIVDMPHDLSVVLYISISDSREPQNRYRRTRVAGFRICLSRFYMFFFVANRPSAPLTSGRHSFIASAERKLLQQSINPD